MSDIGLRFPLALLMSAILAGGLHAQGQTGGSSTGGATNGTTGGSTNGASMGTGATDGAAVGLDSEAAFSNVQRGDAVGTTAGTGAGFSDVGQTAGGPASGLGGLGGLGGGGFGGGLGGLGGLFGGLGGTTSQTSEPPVIRTRLRSAITVAPTNPARVQQIANSRFRSSSMQRQLRGVNVDMQGRTAVISGTVVSQRDRRMSELLMRLEPGVSQIDNRVIVSQ